MAAVCFTPGALCGGQANRLDCDGNILSGPTDVVVLPFCELLDSSVAPTIVTGEILEAPGGCAKREEPDKITGYTGTLTACPRTNPAWLELNSTATLLVDDTGVTGATIGDIVGYDAYNQTTPCACPGAGCANPGISLLLWHRNDDVTSSSNFPYVIRAFPRAIFTPVERPAGRTYTETQWTIKLPGNANWGQGPGDIYPNTAGVGVRPYAEWATTQTPPVTCDCDTCGYYVP